MVSSLVMSKGKYLMSGSPRLFSSSSLIISYIFFSFRPTIVISAPFIKNSRTNSLPRPSLPPIIITCFISKRIGDKKALIFYNRKLKKGITKNSNTKIVPINLSWVFPLRDKIATNGYVSHEIMLYLSTRSTSSIGYTFLITTCSAYCKVSAIGYVCATSIYNFSGS